MLVVSLHASFQCSYFVCDMGEGTHMSQCEHVEVREFVGVGPPLVLCGFHGLISGHKA